MKKEISITHSECASVAVVTKQPKRMSRIILSSVACPVLQYFYKLSNERHDFQEEVIEHATCVLIFSTDLSETLLVLRRIQGDIIINVYTNVFM